MRIETVTGSKPVYVAGQEVPNDPTANFLAKRKVAVTRFEDGTLETFNAQSEGQGGAQVAAAARASALTSTRAL